MGPIQFHEAINRAKSRGVVLPDVYYGELQGLARSMSFSIAGITSIDQLNQVMDSLEKNTANGESFHTWQKRIADGEIPLDLPPHRIENIFRTNLQGHYARGRCEQMRENVDSHPWLMYDAVNDSRTRPAHAAMNGFVARHDDPIWRKWNAPNGYQCRCRLISLSDSQVDEYQKADANRLAKDETLKNDRIDALTNGPDKGWDYSVCSEPTEGLKRALEEKFAKGRIKPIRESHEDIKRAINEKAKQGLINEIEKKVSQLDPTIVKSLVKEIQSAKETAALSETLGIEVYERLKQATKAVLPVYNLTEAQGIILAAYTDSELMVCPLMNWIAREIPHTVLTKLNQRDFELACAWLAIMDAALAKLPSIEGVFYRGMNSSWMMEGMTRFISAHKQDVVVQYAGYTSVMAVEDMVYEGDLRLKIYAKNAKNLRDFSILGEPELLLPRDIQLTIIGYSAKDGDLPHRDIVMEELTEKKTIPTRRMFSAQELESFQSHKGEAEEMAQRWQAWKDAGSPMTPEQKRRSEDHLERTSVEMGGPIPARFKSLQYLNKS